jgi:AraC-like DNA-binding protein
VNIATGTAMIFEKLTIDKGLFSSVCAGGLLQTIEFQKAKESLLPSNIATPKRIKILDFQRIIDHAATELNSESLGLQFSRDLNSSVLGLAGQAMLHANTTIRALQIYRDYICLLIEHLNVEFREAGSVFELVLTYPPLTENWDQFLDFDAGLAVRMLRKCLGSDWNPAYVSLQRSKPQNTNIHESIFGKRTTFGSRRTVIAIAKESMPINSEPDRIVFDLIENQCAIEIRKLRDSLSLKDRVELELLRRIPQDNISIVSISTHFNMSIRNFQRRLAIEGTSFENLIETTRKELSSHFLKDESIAISRISYLLGYSSPNAYSRAAKQWYHMPPSEQRVAFKY